MKKIYSFLLFTLCFTTLVAQNKSATPVNTIPFFDHKDDFNLKGPVKTFKVTFESRPPTKYIFDEKGRLKIMENEKTVKKYGYAQRTGNIVTIGTRVGGDFKGITYLKTDTNGNITKYEDDEFVYSCKYNDKNLLIYWSKKSDEDSSDDDFVFQRTYYYNDKNQVTKTSIENKYGDITDVLFSYKKIKNSSNSYLVTIRHPSNVFEELYRDNILIESSRNGMKTKYKVTLDSYGNKISVLNPDGSNRLKIEYTYFE